MIIYNDILGKLKEAGYTTYRIREENILPQSVVQRLRTGKPITTDTLDTLCNLLNCQPGDLIRYEAASAFHSSGFSETASPKK